jgi:AcrR family transcriptional regulator
MVSVAPSDESLGGIDRRALLIDAAYALFTERAYDEVTTVEIARRAGVAYGLIAHYFANKHGLYLATLTALTERVYAVNTPPPTNGSPAVLLREALTRHIAHVEDNADGFRALMRGGIGSDPQVREVIENFRWRVISRLLRALGASEPFPPALRTAMRGWANFVADGIVDYLRHRDLTRADLVELTVATLVATLRAAHAIDPATGIPTSLINQLEYSENTPTTTMGAKDRAHLPVI